MANHCWRACESSNGDRNVSRFDWFHRPTESTLPITTGADMPYELLQALAIYGVYVAGFCVVLGLCVAGSWWMERNAERREENRQWDEECRKSREARLARESR